MERYVNGKVLAMIPYGKVEKWPSIPRAGLLDRLSQKNIAFACSDQIPAIGPFKAPITEKCSL